MMKDLVSHAFRGRDVLSCVFYALTSLLSVAAIGDVSVADERPNVVFLFADDLGRYASVYRQIDGPGTLNDIVNTPNIDRIAAQGISFRNAFVNAPSCTPCRTSLNAGQPFWRGRSASVLQGARWNFELPAFPLMLEKSGYGLGKMYKVWSPGSPVDAPIGGNKHAFQKRGGRVNGFSKVVTELAQGGKAVEEAKNEILAEVSANFTDFLDAQSADAPFFFWYGPTNVHRMWEKGSGKKLWNIDPESLRGKVPPFLPDVPEIREDLADYLGEVQAFDAAIGVIVEVLKKRGKLDNTVLIVSGDHGAPGFTHGKCNLYDFGCQVSLFIQPTAEMRSKINQGGHVVDDLVSLVDVAPTILELCSVAPDSSMTGRSLVKQITAGRSGIIEPSFSSVVMGRERHVAAAQGDFSHYPQRALRTKDYLYIINYAPDRWPMGIAKFMDADGKVIGEEPSLEQLTKNTFTAFGDMDSSPTKAWLVANRNLPDVRPFYDLAFARRPREELYDLRSDPYQLTNKADDSNFAEVKAKLRETLRLELIRTSDPRVVGEGSYFEQAPMSSDPQQARFVLHRPQAYEVFQRQPNGRGKVLVRGALPLSEAGNRRGGAGAAQGRGADNGDKNRTEQPMRWQWRAINELGEVVAGWQDLEVTAGDPYLDEIIELPQGGWYRIEVRNEHIPNEIVRSGEFAVGDIYLVAGQSNSANYGSEKLQPSSGYVVAFDGNRWQRALDPQLGAAGGGGSFIPPLGDLLHQASGVPIGFASIGVGGTSVREWLPVGSRYEKLTTTGGHSRVHPEGGYECTGELFNNLVNRLVYLGPQGCRAVLWHQGESDAGQARSGYPADRQISGDDYRQYMELLIRRSREVAGWDVPWFTALATYHSESDAMDDEFRDAQRSIWKLDNVFAGPDSDSLRIPFRDGVHFNRSGLEAHARLWAEAMTLQKKE